MQVDKLLYKNLIIPNKIAKKVSNVTQHANNSKALKIGLMMLAASNIANISINKNSKLYAQEVSSIEINYNQKFKNDYGKYGSFYAKNIPNKENIEQHYNYISELKNISKNIQGCEYKNPAVLNGLSAEEIKQKVLKPARAISLGEKFGENQKTLVYISAENSLDTIGAFDDNYSSNVFTLKYDPEGFFDCKFDESFLEHYDNIILIQPNGVSADKTLDTAFANIEKCLGNKAELDVAVMAHGKTDVGFILSTLPSKSDETARMDVTDFKPEEQGGNSYAKSIKNIFERAASQGIKSRFIGDGCYSDFMQSYINNIIDTKYIDYVTVIGAPYKTNSMCVIGFVDNKISFNAYVDAFKNKKGLIINISENGKMSNNNIEKTDFLMTREEGMKIIDKNQPGSFSKKNGTVLNYEILQYR